MKSVLVFIVVTLLIVEISCENVDKKENGMPKTKMMDDNIVTYRRQAVKQMSSNDYHVVETEMKSNGGYRIRTFYTDTEHGAKLESPQMKEFLMRGRNLKDPEVKEMPMKKVTNDFPKKIKKGRNLTNSKDSGIVQIQSDINKITQKPIEEEVKVTTTVPSTTKHVRTSRIPVKTTTTAKPVRTSRIPVKTTKPTEKIEVPSTTTTTTTQKVSDPTTEATTMKIDTTTKVEHKEEETLIAQPTNIIEKTEIKSTTTTAKPNDKIEVPSTTTTTTTQKISDPTTEATTTKMEHKEEEKLIAQPTHIIEKHEIKSTTVKESITTSETPTTSTEKSRTTTTMKIVDETKVPSSVEIKSSTELPKTTTTVKISEEKVTEKYFPEMSEDQKIPVSVKISSPSDEVVKDNDV